MVTIPEVEQYYAARITALDATPFLQPGTTSTRDAEAFHESPVPLDVLADSSLYRHLAFSVIASDAPYTGGNDDPGVSVATQVRLRVLMLYRIRPRPAVSDGMLSDMRLAAEASRRVYSALLKDGWAEANVLPVNGYRPGPLDGEWMTVEVAVDCFIDYQLFGGIV